MPAVGILTAPLLARALGPEGRGQLAGILQPLVLASAIAALGVPSAVTYFVGRSYNIRHVVKIASLLASGMTLIVALLLVAYGGTIASRLQVDLLPLFLIWSAFLPSAFISIRRAVLQGLRTYKPIDYERVAAAFLRVIGVVALYILGSRSVVSFAAWYMMSGLIASFAFIKIEKTNARELVSPRWGEIFRYSLMASFGTIAVVISGRLDQAILPAAVGPIQLGYYSVAVAVAEIPNIISMVISRNLLAEVSAGRRDRIVLTTVGIGVAAIAVVIAMLYVGAPIIFPIVFGHDFGNSIEIARVLLIGTFMAYLATCTSSYLAGKGRPGFSSIGPAIGGITTSLLFALLWANMTVVDAAWISVLSQVMSFAASVLLVIWLRRMGRA